MLLHDDKSSPEQVPQDGVDQSTEPEQQPENNADSVSEGASFPNSVHIITEKFLLTTTVTFPTASPSVEPEDLPENNPDHVPEGMFLLEKLYSYTPPQNLTFPNLTFPYNTRLLLTS